jgi:hypothetical protein
MAVVDALDMIRAASARRDNGTLEPNGDANLERENAHELEDAEAARAAFRWEKRKLEICLEDDRESVENVGAGLSIGKPDKKIKRDFAAVLGIKRKTGA